jgi:hypothetical protein
MTSRSAKKKKSPKELRRAFSASSLPRSKNQENMKTYGDVRTRKQAATYWLQNMKKKTVTPPSLLLDSKPATTRDTAEAKKKQYI